MSGSGSAVIGRAYCFLSEDQIATQTTAGKGREDICTIRTSTIIIIVIGLFTCFFFPHSDEEQTKYTCNFVSPFYFTPSCALVLRILDFVWKCIFISYFLVVLIVFDICCWELESGYVQNIFLSLTLFYTPFFTCDFFSHKGKLQGY